MIVRLFDTFEDFRFGRSIEHRSDRLESENRCSPAEVRLENLTEVHTSRNAQRVQDDVHLRSIFQERHVFRLHDTSDDALVSVTSSHLVTDAQLTLGCDGHFDHFQHARRKFVATLHLIQLTFLLCLNLSQTRSVFVVESSGLLLRGGFALDPLDIERLDLLHNHFVVVALTGLLTGHRIDHRTGEQGIDIRTHQAEHFADPHIHIGTVGLHGFLQILLLLVGHVRSAAKPLGSNHDAFFTGGQFQRVILDIFASSAKDGMQQFFFRTQFALGLWRHLADEDVVSRVDFRPDLNHAIGVEISKCLFRHIRDIAGEFFASQFRLANFHFVFFQVDTREHVVTHQLFADDDRILEVVPVERHEGDETVSSQCQFALARGRTVGQNLTGFNFFAFADEGFLVQASSFVELVELTEFVFVGIVNDDAFGIDVGDLAALASFDDESAVLDDFGFHARSHDGGFGTKQGHGLALHVRSHQRAVGIIVLEERNQRGRHTHGLLGADIDVADFAGGAGRQFTIHTGQHSAVR